MEENKKAQTETSAEEKKQAARSWLANYIRSVQASTQPKNENEDKAEDELK